MVEYVALYKKRSSESLGALEHSMATFLLGELELSNQVYARIVTEEQAEKIKASILNRPLSPGVEAIFNKSE